MSLGDMLPVNDYEILAFDAAILSPSTRTSDSPTLVKDELSKMTAPDLLPAQGADLRCLLETYSDIFDLLIYLITL